MQYVVYRLIPRVAWYGNPALSNAYGLVNFVPRP